MTEKAELTPEEKGLDLLISIIGAFGNSALGALVFRDIWNWFMSEPFGLAHLTWAQSVGAGFVYGFFSLGVMRLMLRIEAEKKRAAEQVLQGTLLYLIIWGFAAIWHAVM